LPPKRKEKKRYICYYLFIYLASPRLITICPFLIGNPGPHRRNWALSFQLVEWRIVTHTVNSGYYEVNSLPAVRSGVKSIETVEAVLLSMCSACARGFVSVRHRSRANTISRSLASTFVAKTGGKTQKEGMATRRNLFLAFLVFNAAALSLPFSTTVAAVADEHVLALTSNSFDDAVGKDKAALVEFYSPW